MAAIKSISCEFYLIKAWTPVNRPHLKASIKSITDLKIAGIDRHIILYSVIDLPDSRYLLNMFDVNTYNHSLVMTDLESITLMRDPGSKELISMLAKNGIIFGTKFRDHISLFRDGIVLGSIDIIARLRICSCGSAIMNRWLQMTSDSVYVIDDGDSLYRVAWSDVVNAGKVHKTLVENKIEEFFVAANGVALIDKTGQLKIPGGTIIDLHKIVKDAENHILIKAAKHWIVSVDLNGKAVISSINGSGKVCGRLKIKMTSFKSQPTAMMYSMKSAGESRGRSALLAVEREGCGHLISMDSRGPMIVVARIACLIVKHRTIVHGAYDLIYAITGFSKNRDVVVGGLDDLKRSVLELGKLGG